MAKITKVPNRELYRAKVANPMLGRLPNGRVKQQVIYGKTRDEVKEKIALIEIDVITGKFVTSNDIRVDHYLRRWLELHRPDLKPITYIWRRLILPEMLGLGSFELDFFSFRLDLFLGDTQSPLS